MKNLIVRVCGTDIAISGRLIRTGCLDGEMYKFLEDPEPLVEALRNGQTPLDLFTFVQGLTERSPKHRYPIEWDNLAALELSTFEQWWNQQIGPYARNRARQAERKGVRLLEVPLDDALVRGVWDIYNESPLRQGRPFRHYGKPLDLVRRELSTFLDSSVFIGAFEENTLIGFVKLTVDDTRTQAGLMQIVSMIRHRDKSPTNALIARAVRLCTERAIPYLVYSRFSYGKKRRDGLTHFKERNGFRRIDVPRYYIPLTRRGSLALRMGLHHRLIDYLPARLLEMARELRAAWYSRRMRAL